MLIDNEIDALRQLLKAHSLSENEKNKAVNLLKMFYALKKEVAHGLPDSGPQLWISCAVASILSALSASLANDSVKLKLFAAIGNLIGHYIGKEIGQRYFANDLDSVPHSIIHALNHRLPVSAILLSLEELNYELFKRSQIQNVDHFRIYLAATVTGRYAYDVFTATILSGISAFLCDWVARPDPISKAVQIFKKDIRDSIKGHANTQDNAERRYPRM